MYMFIYMYIYVCMYIHTQVKGLEVQEVMEAMRADGIYGGVYIYINTYIYTYMIKGMCVPCRLLFSC